MRFADAVACVWAPAWHLKQQQWQQRVGRIAVAATRGPTNPARRSTALQKLLLLFDLTR